MMIGRFYSEEHGSVEKELIMRYSHTRPPFNEDKSKVYYYIKEATRTKFYASSTKSFHKRINGRDAFLEIFVQYVGDYKWQKLLKDSTKILQN